MPRHGHSRIARSLNRESFGVRFRFFDVSTVSILIFGAVGLVGFRCGWLAKAHFSSSFSSTPEQAEILRSAQSPRPLGNVDAALPDSALGQLSWAEALLRLKAAASTSKARVWSRRYVLAIPLSKLRTVVLTHLAAATWHYDEAGMILALSLLQRWAELAPQTLLQKLPLLAPDLMWRAAQIVLDRPDISSPAVFRALLQATPPLDAQMLRGMALARACTLPATSLEVQELCELFGINATELLRHRKEREWAQQGPLFLREVLKSDPTDWSEEQKNMAQSMCSLSPEAFRITFASEHGPALARSGFFDQSLWAFVHGSPEVFTEFLQSDAGLIFMEDPVRLQGLCSNTQDAPWLLSLVATRCDPSQLSVGAKEALIRGAARTMDVGQWTQLLSHWPAEEAAGAFATWVEERGKRKPETIIQDFSAAVASMDAEQRAAAAGRAGAVLGTLDPESAISWCRTLDGAVRTAAVDAVLRKLSEWNPAMAIESLNAVGLADAGLPTVAALASKWAGADTALTDQWVAGLPEPQRSAARMGLLQNMPSVHEAAAALDVLHSHDLPQELAPLVQEQSALLASRWATTDPAGAIEWLMDRGYHAQPPTLVEQLGKEWAVSDPIGMADWLATRQADPANDRLVEQLVSQLKSDPAAAFHWSQRISDATTRAALGLEYLSLLRNSDPDAARAILTSLPLERQQEIGAINYESP